MPPIRFTATGNSVAYTVTNSTFATVTWSAVSSNWTVIPSQSTLTYASGITSRPDWQAARVRHIEYRQRNEDLMARDLNPLRIHQQGYFGGQRFDSEESRREAREEWDRRRAEEREAGRLARARAEELLLRYLSEDQRESYRTRGGFEVIGSHGSRFFISQRAVANIIVLNDDGASIAYLCAHPAGEMPAADMYLAQKLALETDEHTIVGLANCHRGRPVTYDALGRMLTARLPVLDRAFAPETWCDDSDDEDGEVLMDLTDEIPSDDAPVIQLIPERRLA